MLYQTTWGHIPDSSNCQTYFGSEEHASNMQYEESAPFHDTVMFRVHSRTKGHRVCILFIVFLSNYLYVRFEVFMAVTEEWCLLGCYAVWLL
jgi:hypothetical protein